MPFGYCVGTHTSNSLETEGYAFPRGAWERGFWNFATASLSTRDRVVDVGQGFVENALHRDAMSPVSMVNPVGSPAIINHELRQARKGATVVVTLCAGVWLTGFASNILWVIFFGPSFLDLLRVLRQISSSFAYIQSNSCISRSSWLA